LLYPQLLHQPPELGQRASSLQLLEKRLLFFRIPLEYAVAIPIHGLRYAVPLHDTPHQKEAALRIFMLPEHRPRRLACGVVYGPYKAHPGTSAFKPVVRAAVDLQHRPFRCPPLTP